MKLANGFQRVDNLDVGEALEKVVHQAILRCPDRFVAQGCKFSAQEHASSFARENDRDIAHIVREVRQHIGCYEGEKRIHNLQFIIIARS